VENVSCRICRKGTQIGYSTCDVCGGPIFADICDDCLDGRKLCCTPECGGIANGKQERLKQQSKLLADQAAEMLPQVGGWVGG